MDSMLWVCSHSAICSRYITRLKIYHDDGFMQYHPTSTRVFC
ncbi:hypothetical protein [Methermicoccus shengliensis]|nr:hypothetical protein [Methermicoccus shengliensis]